MPRVIQTPAPVIAPAAVSASVVFGNRVSQGNLLVFFGKATAIGTPTDNLGDGVPWTLIVPLFGASSDKGVWAKIAGASGPCTVTVTGTSSTIRVIAREYDGATLTLSQPAVTVVGAVNAASQSVGPTAALNQGDLVLCGITNGNTLDVTAGPSGPGLNLTHLANANGMVALEDDPAWAGGPAIGSFGFVGGNTFGDLFIVALKSSGSPLLARFRRRLRRKGR